MQTMTSPTMPLLFLPPVPLTVADQLATYRIPVNVDVEAVRQQSFEHLIQALWAYGKAQLHAPLFRAATHASADANPTLLADAWRKWSFEHLALQMPESVIVEHVQIERLPSPNSILQTDEERRVFRRPHSATLLSFKFNSPYRGAKEHQIEQNFFQMGQWAVQMINGTDLQDWRRALNVREILAMVALNFSSLELILRARYPDLFQGFVFGFGSYHWGTSMYLRREGYFPIGMVLRDVPFGDSPTRYAVPPAFHSAHDEYHVYHWMACTRAAHTTANELAGLVAEFAQSEEDIPYVDAMARFLSDRELVGMLDPVDELCRSFWTLAHLYFTLPDQKLSDLALDLDKQTEFLMESERVQRGMQQVATAFLLREVMLPRPGEETFYLEESIIARAPTEKLLRYEQFLARALSALEKMSPKPWMPKSAKVLTGLRDAVREELREREGEPIVPPHPLRTTTFWDDLPPEWWEPAADTD